MKNFEANQECEAELYRRQLIADVYSGASRESGYNVYDGGNSDSDDH